MLQGFDQVWLKVKSNIRVKNLGKLPTDVLLAFPVCNNPKDAKSHEQYYFKRNISKNVMNLRFKVTDEKNNKYTTVFSLEDAQKLYVGIFLWKMSFAPGEAKSFVVSYYVPLLRLHAFPGKSMYLSGKKIESGMPEFYSTNEVLYSGLSSSYRLQFEYIITHNCFSQRIKPKTTIQVCLLPIMNELDRYKTAWCSEIFEGTISFLKHPFLLALISPKPDQVNNGTVYWRKISNSCKIYFFKTRFPKETDEMNRFIDSVFNEKQKWLNVLGKIYKTNITTSNGDIREEYLKELHNIKRLKRYPYLKKDLHDIYLEFISKQTNNKRILPFLKKQIWYNAHRKMMNDFIVMYH